MQNSEEKMAADITAKTPTLSASEKAALWNKVEAVLPVTPVVSPYSFVAQFKKQSAPIALALVVLLSTTGLVAASEPARPGDSLFTIDQSIENIRLALASEDEKTRLEAEFAAERLLELSSVLEEALVTNQEKNQATTTISTEGDMRVSDALAITLSYFGSTRLSNDTKDDLYNNLAEILEGSAIKIDDKRLRLLNDDSKIEIRSDDSHKDSRIEIRDGENRMRIREKNGELRIDIKGDWEEDDDEDKDDDKNDRSDDDRDDKQNNWNDQNKNSRDDKDEGDDRDNDSRNTLLETEINTNLFDDDSRDRNDDENEDVSPEAEDDTEVDRSDSDDDQANDSTNELKIEARVEDGRAKVRIEQDSNQSEFTIPYTTEAALIIGIALKTGLANSTIGEALDLEFKD